MLKRNRAQKYGNNQLKFGCNFKGFCRVRMLVSHMSGEGLVKAKPNIITS